MPRARPLKDIMLREILKTYIKKNVVTIEIGIDNPMINVVVILRRKTKRMMMARMPP